MKTYAAFQRFSSFFRFASFDFLRLISYYLHQIARFVLEAME